MNGVEILSTQEVVTESTSNWWLAGIIWLACIVVGGIIGFFCFDYYERCQGSVFGCCAIGALLGIFVFVVVCAVTAKPVACETQYKVTISDEVSMNEFLDKYEIIDQEGKIYTVRERE